MKTNNQLCHTVLVDPLLAKQPVVVDCGSNHGEFANWAYKVFNARVYGYEPDPRLYPKLVSNDQIHYFQKAITGNIGTSKLHLGEGQCSSLHYAEDASHDTTNVETTTLAAEFAAIGLDHVDLLKLDIEGAELDVLLETPEDVLQCITQITVEFHEFMRPADLPQILECIKRLRGIGFRPLFFSTHTYGDILFVNREHLPLTRFQCLRILIRGKYLPGLRRTLKRWCRLKPKDKM